jgi:hypothetical protein
VFKRFDDGPEEEEPSIDTEDLGLLEHTDGGADALRLLKPMTRRSIKPTRLFQTEEQKRAREAEKIEEEVTDIEIESNRADAGVSSSPASRSALHSRRSPRSTTTRSAETPKCTEDTGDLSPAVDETTKATNRSPFDSWKRVKRGSAVSTAATSKGRKRAASTLEADTTTTDKKLRSHS